MKQLAEIRTTFLEYFQKSGHTVVPSSSLIPRNDPTLLFTNAGMVQFKDVFTGLEKPSYTKAATAQKCLRVGGKHNDLDNVGYTARHHTFFEMLGNFSFGDYFKETAIELAWQLLTVDFGIAKERLCITYYDQDQEAAKLWHKISALPSERIIPIATSDNFWSMGKTGPCGPCSEIFYDHGESVSGGLPGTAEADGDRFVEIWNLVFMQYDAQANGSQILLPTPSIDTGMGLERIAAILQGVASNFEIDLFKELINTSIDFTNNPKQIHSHRIIADHLRAIAFLIADGVTPTNEGRGYVLRRIMRRAMRHVHLLGSQEPLLWKMVPVLCNLMGAAYNELIRSKAQITTFLKIEEERFRETLSRGLTLLQESTDSLPPGTPLDGAVAFKLYDTYGFPLDLTQEVLKGLGHTVDLDKFIQAMNEQRLQARASWAGSGEAKESPLWFDLLQELGPTEFVGYEHNQAGGVVKALVRGTEAQQERVEQAATGEEILIITNQTPFYGEGGGQIGDTGIIESAHARIEVINTQRKLQSLIVHQAKILTGTIKQSEAVRLIVDSKRRNNIKANHSATHLLHASLRQILGQHVMQKGSLVATHLLRFDFAHPAPLTKQEIRAIEQLVNQLIIENHPTIVSIATRENAIAQGAIALFGERYSDEVRVLQMGSLTPGEPFSIELCGGTHVTRTGDIGLFRIVSESGVAAGVRRIIAKTGLDAINHALTQEDLLEEAAKLLKTTPEAFFNRLKGLLKEKKELQHQIVALRQKLSAPQAQLEKIGRFPVTIQSYQDMPIAQLKSLVDSIKTQMGSGIIIITNVSEGKVSLVIGVTEDLTDEANAVELVRLGAEILGGKGGGGRPDLAQAGGVNPEAISRAVEAIKTTLENIPLGCFPLSNSPVGGA